MNNFDWRKTINVNLAVLRSVGLWPKGYEVFQWDSYLFYSAVATITIIGGHNLSQIVNIYYVYDDLEALSGTIFIAATNIFAVVKRYFFVQNLKLIKQLFGTLNTYQFRPKISRHMDLVQASVKNWRRAYISFSVLVYLNVALWSVVPVLNNLTVAGRRELPFEAWYPFNSKVSPNYEIAYFYQLVCIWYITVSNLNQDTLIYAFIMFIGSQCDILTDDLQHLRGKDFSRKLTNCIKHHKEILRFTKNSNNFFNFIILGQIATSTAALALAMFQLSLVESNSVAFTHLAYIFGMSAEIFLYCWFGNEVTLKGEKISYAVYQSEWVGQPQKTLRNLLILCIRCQKPMRITAINLFALSLHTFLNILRSAWSYFAVLSTVNKK